MLSQNIDPQTYRQQQEQAKHNELNNTYENVAWAWLEHRKTKKNFSENYQRDVIALIKNNLLPHFGALPITQITAPMAIKAFKPYQDEGLSIKLSGGKVYLFPSVKNPQKHVPPQTANGAIKRMGYKGKLVAHGMRSIASTYLNEKGYNSDLIEVALSHINSDRVKAAYDKGKRLSQRFKLLQAWADFVEESSQGRCLNII